MTGELSVQQRVRMQQLIVLAETTIWTAALAAMMRRELQGRVTVSPYADPGEMADTMRAILDPTPSTHKGEGE